MRQCSSNSEQISQRGETMRAPATGKAREPMEVSRTAGTIRSSEVEDRSLARRVIIIISVYLSSWHMEL